MSIPAAILEAVEGLMARLDRGGEQVDREVLERLKSAPGARVPDWLIDLLVEFPLAGVQIGVRVTDSFAGFSDQPVMFELGDASLIEELNTESYPGMYLFPRGYVALGCGVEWAGDVLVMATTSDDPPVYQVWHDVSDDPEELERAVLSQARGTRLISPTLSQLFSEGLVEPPPTAEPRSEIRADAVRPGDRVGSMPDDPDPEAASSGPSRRLHPVAGCALFVVASAVLTVLLPSGRTPDKIFEEAVSGPPAAAVELPRGTWVGAGVRSLTEPGMWVDGQKENEESLRVTLQSPGFGTVATVRMVIDGGEDSRAGWTSRVELESAQGRLRLRFVDDERWRLDPIGDEFRLIVIASRQEGLEGESFVLGLRKLGQEDDR